MESPKQAKLDLDDTSAAVKAEYRPKTDAPFGTLNYFASKLKKPTKERERYLIGEFNTY
jgi:hypothetical protein